jgi:hypothetical protein
VNQLNQRLATLETKINSVLGDKRLKELIERFNDHSDEYKRFKNDILKWFKDL